MTLIAFAGEDNNHFRVVTALVDDALVTNFHWMRDVLDSCRSWCGLGSEERWYKYASADALDLRPMKYRGVRFAPQGWIAGEPLKSGAGMWRRVLMLFLDREPRPDIVVLACDLDGYPDRRDGLEQVCAACPGRLRSWPRPRSRRSRRGSCPASCRGTKASNAGSISCAATYRSIRRSNRTG